MKDGQSRTPLEMTLLFAGEKQLIDGAATNPGAYLPALKAIKKIINAGQNGKVSAADLALAEKGMNALLGKKEITPASETAHSSSALSRSYFNQLKRTMP
jgi:phosphosulfolactate phosphohydrolase-like enzyme